MKYPAVLGHASTAKQQAQAHKQTFAYLHGPSRPASHRTIQLCWLCTTLHNKFNSHHIATACSTVHQEELSCTLHKTSHGPPSSSLKARQVPIKVKTIPSHNLHNVQQLSYVHLQSKASGPRLAGSTVCRICTAAASGPISAQHHNNTTTVHMLYVATATETKPQATATK